MGLFVLYNVYIIFFPFQAYDIENNSKNMYVLSTEGDF